MPRKTSSWLLVSLLVAVLLLGFSLLTRVPTGSRALLRGNFGVSEPRILEPGLHVRIPLVQVVHLYPAGEIRLEGNEEVTSSEGVNLRLSYILTGRIDPERLSLFDERARGRVARIFLEEAVRRRLSAWISEESAAQWVAWEGGPAPAAVVDEIRSLGLTDLRLTLGKVKAPPEAEQAAALDSLRKQARPTDRKILVVGLDGADWQLIDPWIRSGKLPVLGRLKEQGAWANLKSMQPILSPLLWTTVATGRRPEDHGVVDFLVRDPATGQKVPISSRFRKVQALWNIFTGMGRTVDAVAWWASWPAESVNGVVVSDRVSYSLFGYQSDPESLPGATYPAGYLASLRGRLASDGDISLEEVRKFADISAVDFQQRRAQIDRGDPRKAYADPVNHLTRILAATRNYKTVTLDLLSRGQPDLMLVYFQGIDEVGHRFAHLMPPKMRMVSEEDYRRFRGTVEAFYVHQDQILGEILSHADPRTLVMVLSDHGFKNGPGRPTDDPPFIEGKPGKWHRLYGIFVMAGPGVKRGQIDTVSLLDVAPTVLALAGLPPSLEMPGRVLTEALKPKAAREIADERVATYELGPRPEPAVANASAADREMIENLRSLGYIGGGGEPKGSPAGPAADELSGETVTYHSNLAALQLRAKRYERAQSEVEAALKLAPNYVPALMTQASIYKATDQPAKALEVYRRVAEGGDAEAGVFGAIAHLYVELGRTSEGLDYFSRLSPDGSGGAEVVTARGILQEAAGDPAAAEGSYRRALDRDPAATAPAARLYEILKKRGQESELKPMVARALAINENSVAHHNLMGLLEQKKGDLRSAEGHLRRAAELDPDYAGVLANLGSLLARTGRGEEAIRVLSRAVEKEPGNYEGRMNLGAALGKAGRHREAILQFEEARRRGFRSPALFNGLAVAYHETGDFPRCIENLRESLALDPNQPEVRGMLEEVQARPS